MNSQGFKKFLFIGTFIFIFILGILLGARIFFMASTKEKRDELKGLAKRLFEKPVQIEMERPRKAKALIKGYEEGKPPDEILVDDFDAGLTSGVFSERKNRLGSYQGTWAMRPSFAIITKSNEIRRGDRGQSLVIEYKKEAGWCGWYTRLNDIDVTPYNTLSFWVRGEQGGEKFDVGLTDTRMQELEVDAFFLGSVNAFLPPAGMTKEWQEVKVPLARASSEINLSSMGGLVFWFRYGGQGRIYVEDVKFKNDPGTSKVEEFNAPQASKDLLCPRALWVWKIDPVNNIKQRKELFQLCGRTNISVLYLFFPEPAANAPPDYFKALSEFLTESHSRAIKVEALTGNPSWALAENHQLLLNWIKFFLDYNKDRPGEERIDGASLDVEPYLIAEWQQDRERVRREYIDLLRKSRELIDSYEQEFRLGVAIPFFYDKEDGGRFERSILDYVDYIALMDYYDTSKDIIEKGRPHIALAKEANKKVIIAVETQDLVEMRQGKRRNTFIEEGWEWMELQLEKVKQEFLYEPSLEGFAIHHYDSYKLMTRGRNAPTRARQENYIIKAGRRTKDIVLDGRLDDWDLSLPYEILDNRYVVYGSGSWAGPKDVSYKFYSQWDEQALYAAIDVSDDKVIQEKTAQDMWEGDHVELWVDIDLTGDLNETINSEDDFQFGLSPGNFTNSSPEVYVWTPVLPDELKYKERIKIGASRTQNGYIIEARIPKEVLFYEGEGLTVNVGPGEGGGRAIFQLASEAILSLHKGFRMGIMVDVGDTDDEANPMKLLMSTSENRAWGDPTTFGVVELE